VLRSNLDPLAIARTVAKARSGAPQARIARIAHTLL
jgi:hypothetical protein